MASVNAVGEARKIWRILPVAPANMLVDTARKAEDEGVEGVFAYQVYGPPFIPLSAAAAATSTLKLASGIAIAASRSPFETAMAARDLDLISEGRFTLGLGSSVPAWTKGVFGAGDIKPLAHLRDTVEAIRHIHPNAHLGLEPYEGTYYQADFEAFRAAIPPPVNPNMPIWLAALREKLTRMAVEISDGVIGHPIWSVDWAVNQMAPVIDDELQIRQRQRSDIQVSIWPWAAPNTNEKEAIDDVRPTVAFYGGAREYESYFEAHGFLDIARKLQKALPEEGFEKAARHVPDEMVKAFIAVGDPEKVREHIEPVWGVANSICVIPPLYAMTPEKFNFYSEMIAETFKPNEL